jgi:hypothetical protein
VRAQLLIEGALSEEALRLTLVSSSLLQLLPLHSQSHEPEFDYLKSLEIEEKINRIKWCKRQNSAHFLLSTNGAFWPA